MAVLTTDVLVEGVRRDDLLDWLARPENHERFLAGTFDEVKRTGERTWELSYKAFPHKRVLGYEIVAVDDSHGGRRLNCRTTGKRTTGQLHYSLRTMKPSTNTLVTLHMDYEPGGGLGDALNAMGIRTVLETGFKKVLENLQRAVNADHAPKA